MYPLPFLHTPALRATPLKRIKEVRWTYVAVAVQLHQLFCMRCSASAVPFLKGYREAGGYVQLVGYVHLKQIVVPT